MSNKMLDSLEIPGFGKIDIGEIYSYYDGPVLFSGVREATQSLYLIVFADEDNDKDTWLCAMISPERLKQVEHGEIDLHDAFAEPEQGQLTYVQAKGETFLRLVSAPVAKVPSNFFPLKGEFLGESQQVDYT